MFLRFEWQTSQPISMCWQRKLLFQLPLLSNDLELFPFDELLLTKGSRLIISEREKNIVTAWTHYTLWNLTSIGRPFCQWLEHFRSCWNIYCSTVLNFVQLYFMLSTLNFFGNKHVTTTSSIQIFFPTLWNACNKLYNFAQKYNCFSMKSGMIFHYILSVVI